MQAGDLKKIRESSLSFEELHDHIPVFDISNVEKITKPDTALSDMLNHAMKFEEESIKFYSDCAQKEVNKNMRLLFEALTKQEQEHKTIIKRFGFKLLGVSPSTIK